MRIVAWRDSFEGSFLYRLGLPLMAAQDQGLAAVAFRDYGSALECDVLIGQRLYEPAQIEAWNAASAPLKVLEYDDDLLSLRYGDHFSSSDQELYRAYQSEWVPAAAAALTASDLVTVSVPHLAERLRQHTDTPIVVLPNTIHHILLGTAPSTRQAGQPLRAGWAGTQTHHTDWEAHASGIRRGLKATNAQMVMVGADYREVLDYPAESRPWSNSLTEYYESISDFHVMLAPLAEDVFNLSKSPIKALEAAALGIPTIASAKGPYADFVIDGETGFLCEARRDWERALRILSNDEDARQAMGLAARAQASTLVTRDWAPQWIQAYSTALAAKGLSLRPA